MGGTRKTKRAELRVRVTQIKGFRWPWYTGQIGNEFEVYDDGPAKGSYVVKQTPDASTVRCIHKNDCVVVE